MAKRQFKAKEILFRERDAANEAFVIISGKIEVLKSAPHGEVQLAVLGERDVLGEMGLFEQGSMRSASARAVTDGEVEVISREEFEASLNQCPANILPVILTVINRLRQTNRRVSQAEQATAILDSDITKIVVKPDSKQTDFAPLEAHLARLPFKIGGYLAGDETTKNRQNHLVIATEGPPLIVSQQHCQIEVQDGGLYINDLGSRFGTVVNGKVIGRGKGKYKAPLQKGENSVVMGGVESPYRIKIVCE
jgi:CRP/FNR family transcriptional regulator, cyclic AMP receptor protein